MPNTNPAPQKPRQDLPDGRTALVSMFPMHMDQPINGVQPPAQTENRPKSQSNSMNAGK